MREGYAHAAATEHPSGEVESVGRREADVAFCDVARSVVGIVTRTATAGAGYDEQARYEQRGHSSRAHDRPVYHA